MYKPQGIKNKGYLQRLKQCFSAWRRTIRPASYPTRGRRRDSLASHQRNWQLKKLSRSLSLGLLAVLAISSCGWLTYTLLARSDIFQITDLIVEGNSMATRQQILESSGLKRGTNLLTLDIERTKGMISRLQWIDTVTVKRVWPSSVVIRVKEHNPLALINLEQKGRKLYYLDRDGKIFAPLTPTRDLDYPVLTGDALAGDVRGMHIAAGTLTAMALDFLNLAARGNQILPSQAISEVHITRDRGLIVYLVDHPFPIYMGREKIRTRFNLLVRVLAQLYRQDKVKEVGEIRMDYAEDKILVANIGT